MNAPVEHKRLTATLDDKYTLEEGWAFMTGTQALVRLPIQQRLRDRAQGLNTAGYISGYRGSPLGQYDLALWQAGELLAKHDVVFRPGLNEELGFDLFQRGVVVVDIEPGSPAARLRFRRGDIITRLAGERIDSVERLQTVVRAHRLPWQLEVDRGGRALAVVID